MRETSGFVISGSPSFDMADLLSNCHPKFWFQSLVLKGVSGLLVYRRLARIDFEP